jgi:predicted O-methyltransferase YrrM
MNNKQKVNKNTDEISGWFDYSNLYKELVESIPDNGIFVECGAWLGKSSSYLCDIAQERIKVYIVDHWQGSPAEIDSTHKLAKKQDIYQIFLNNMGSRKFIPLKMDSITASKKFENESCDVVYIDMDHTYEAVKQDIKHWLPKVKKGGILAGHDYNWHRVKKAVDELLGPNIDINITSWIYKV